MENSQEELRSLQEENGRLHAILEEMRNRLREPEDLIRAIRYGEVDAFVVNDETGEKIYSLRKADRLYRLMIEEMTEGALTLSADGTVLYCNRHFAQLVQRNREQIIGNAFRPLVALGDQPVLDGLLEQAVTGNSRGEIGLLNDSSEPILASVAVSWLAGLGEGLDGYCLVLSDLTPYKRQEELLRADRRKNEFLAMLSHELRTPLAPVLNALDLLSAPQVDGPTAAEARQIMARQVNHLVRLIDDLLDMSRIIWGKIELRRVPVDIATIVSRAVETARPAIEAHGHQFTVSLPPEPVWLSGDLVRLAQVVANLLSNSAKYTHRGCHIWLTARRTAEELDLRVRDTGRGIEADLLPHVFDLFRQTNDSDEQSAGGLGIGLTLVRNLVEMHGGSVSAHSDGTGQGSEFIVRLPVLTEVPRQELQERTSMTTPSRRVLVVDDNAAGARMLSLLLEKLGGHQVQVAHDGTTALQQVQTVRPEIVLLDIGLPGISGYEVARRLREMPQGRELLLVALTGYGQEEDRQRSQDAGFDEHLVKPPTLDALQGLFNHPKLSPSP